MMAGPIEEDVRVSDELQGAVSHLNRILQGAQQAGLTVDLLVQKQHVIGNAAPIISVSGSVDRVTKANVGRF